MLNHPDTVLLTISNAFDMLIRTGAIKYEVEGHEGSIEYLIQNDDCTQYLTIKDLGRGNLKADLVFQDGTNQPSPEKYIAKLEGYLQEEPSNKKIASDLETAKSLKSFYDRHFAPALV